ncbi:MAG TPA: M48 family metallopeptidase [Methylomirabilota bacterium]
MTTLRLALGLVLALPVITSCAISGAGPVEAPPAGISAASWRPAAGSDEGGLWMEADRMEAELRTSALLIRDSPLTAHVTAVTCRVAGPRCDQVRVYVVRTARANAAMAPNGALLLYTGLLLRTENEAQLAYVLSHEVAHYLRRHGIQQWRDLWYRARMGRILDAGGLGSVAWLGAPAVSRAQEREADEVALDLMSRAGYEARDAETFLEAWLAEESAAGPDRAAGFTAAHPPTAERLAVARAAVAEARRAGAPKGAAPTDSHRRAMAPFLGGFLRDELRRREFGASLLLADRLLASGADAAVVQSFRGEIYRLRGEPDDDARAVAALTLALATGQAPAEAHRSLGLVHMRRGEASLARAAFTRYLEERPDAEDRRMIESYLARPEREMP